MNKDSGPKGHTGDKGKNELCKLCGKIHRFGNRGRHIKSGPREHNGKGICKLCGKIHNFGMKGHTYSHSKNKPCKLCGKIHIAKIHKGKGGPKGHNYDHGRGDICKKCGKIHLSSIHAHKPGSRSGPFGHNFDHEVCKKCGKIHTVKNNAPKKDNKIEIKMQAKLKELNIEFEKHYYEKGKPDIFIKPNICIFCDGCYWHACKQCKPNLIKIRKITVEEKRQKDANITKRLEEKGFIVLRFWEHEINKNLNDCISKILNVYQVTEGFQSPKSGSLTPLLEERFRI